MGSIRDTVPRLEENVLVDASHNAYGDKEFAECRTKEEAKLAELKKRTFLIGTKSVESAKHRRRCCLVADIFGRALLPW